MEQYDKVDQYVDIVSYSSKTNQDVTKILEENTDCMFSVHLENELKHLDDMSRVLFLAQGWDKEYIGKLYAMGIRSFVVDNESDLDIFLEFVADNDVNVNLSLRMKLKELSIRTERYFVFGMGSVVVGKRILEIHNSDARRKIDSLGIHFHRKSQNITEWNLKYQLTQILDENVIDAIDIMNIGGGLPSKYANTNEQAFETIFPKLIELREWLNENNIRMIMEPGRFIAAPSAKLECSIIGIHENNIIVNASVYNTDMDALIVPVKLLIEGELGKDDDGKDYVVKGVTPCSMDLFRYRVRLNNPKVGDKLVFINAGAYNFATDFCDLEKLETVVVEDF